MFTCNFNALVTKCLILEVEWFVKSTNLLVSASSDETASLETMILRSDSRPLDQYDYHQLAYTINARYAKLHGYQIRFFHTPYLINGTNANDVVKYPAKQCVACIHPTAGGRMTPWCKLKAINDTMHRYSQEVDRIVYIDSDAFVNRLDSPLKDEYFDKPLSMFVNNGEYMPCSGIQLWQNNDKSREMGAAWRDSNNTAFNTAHDYEQSVFRERNTKLMRNYWSQVGIIRESIRENRKEMGKNAFFRHITRKKDDARLERMKAFIQRNNITFT